MDRLAKPLTSDGRNPVRLARSFLTVRLQVLNPLSLDFSHNYFRDVPTFDTRLLGIGLLDQFLFQGFSAGLRWKFLLGASVYGNLGSNKRDGDQKAALNYMGGVTLDRGFLPFQVDLRYSRFNSSFGNGNYQSITLIRQVGDKMHMNIQVGYQSLASAFTNQTNAKYGSANIDYVIGRHYILGAGWTLYRGGAQNYDRPSSISVIASEPPEEPCSRLCTRVAAVWMLALALLAALPAKAADDPPLHELLNRVGEQVDRFWNYFSSVACTEKVTQTKLGDKGKVLSERRESFDYLIMLRSRGLDLMVDESRVETARAQSKKDASLLETNGFSLFTLIFHNMYQARYQFQQLPDEPVDGRRLRCLAFQQVSNDHPLSLLHLRERDYPLAWRGKAWVDPASSAVVRIRAGLGDSMADMGLLRLDADVSYSGIRFNGSDPYWLPTRAEVEAQTKRQHWHNTHLFTDYKRFSVETDVKIAPTR